VLTAAVKKRKAVGHWVTSRFGLVLTIGGVLATIAAVLGLMTVAPGLERLIDAGNVVARSEGTPSAEQQARIDQLKNGLKRHGAIDLVLLLLAVVAMATARYW
jgi:predicted RND superfamily exporter protein